MARHRDKGLSLFALRSAMKRGLSRRPLGWRGLQLSIAAVMGVWLLLYAADPNEADTYNRLTETGETIASQLERFLDLRATDLRSLARCARNTSYGIDVHPDANDKSCWQAVDQDLLEQRRTITAFAGRADCAERDDSRERCSVRIYRAAEIWSMPAGRLVARWSAQGSQNCPPGRWCASVADAGTIAPPWVRLAYGGPAPIVVSRLDGNWVPKRSGQPPGAYSGVFHFAARADDSLVVTLDVDHAHVAEVARQFPDVSRTTVPLVPDHLTAGEWLERYEDATYVSMLDDRAWIIAHPKPWHVVGRDPRWGAHPPFLSDVRHRPEGEYPLRLCAAQHIPRMSVFYRAIAETIRLRRPSRVDGYAQLNESPRLAVSVAAHFNRDEFAWAELDDHDGVDEDEPTECRLDTAGQPPLFGLVVVGQHLRELSRHQWFLWTLHRHRWAILIALFAWLTLADPIHRRITRRRSWVEWRPSERLLREIRRAASSIDATTEGAPAHLLEMMRNALVIALPRPPRVCCVALDADRLGADVLSLPWERLAPRESDSGGRARWLPVRVYSPGPSTRRRRGARHKACYGFFSPEHDPKYPPLVDRDGSGLPRREAFDAFTAKVGLVQADNIILGAGQEQALADLAAQCGRGLAWLHLVCHGDTDERGGFLALTDEFRASVNVYGDELAASLSSGGDPPLVVVLEACCSGLDARGVAAALIRAGVEAVVCFRGKPRQDLVTDACRRFYAELAIRRRLDLAVLATRAAPQTADEASDAMSIVIAGERSLDVLVDVVGR